MFNIGFNDKEVASKFNNNNSFSLHLKFTNEIFSLSYDKHNEAWLKNLKFIVYEHKKLYYYRYHLNIFFDYYDIKYIIQNFNTIKSLIKYIKDFKIPEKYIFGDNNDNYKKYYGDILSNLSNIDDNNKKTYI